MSCCGGSSRRKQLLEEMSQMEFVEAVYLPEPYQMVERALLSNHTIDPKTNRRLVIAPKAKSGDIVNVPVRDILMGDSDIFRAPPCGERFQIVGVTLINPCGEPILEAVEPVVEVQALPEEVVDLSEEELYDAVYEIVGTKSRAEKVLKSEIIETPEDLTSMEYNEAKKTFGKIVADKVKAWNESKE